jgi:ABC-type multidrug transport system ATPase subunit
LIGDPKLVLLDEPSTGLDPASRRQLWNVINNQKKKCALLLTTHAMEEADALVNYFFPCILTISECDRIGIFSSGELKCIGSSTELKSRYGKGYKLTVTCDSTQREVVRDFIQNIAPGTTLLNSIAETSNYEVSPTSK